jgi:hypothetical protein
VSVVSVVCVESVESVVCVESVECVVPAVSVVQELQLLENELQSMQARCAEQGGGCTGQTLLQHDGAVGCHGSHLSVGQDLHLTGREGTQEKVWMDGVHGTELGLCALRCGLHVSPERVRTTFSARCARDSLDLCSLRHWYQQLRWRPSGSIGTAVRMTSSTTASIPSSPSVSVRSVPAVP